MSQHAAHAVKSAAEPAPARAGGARSTSAQAGVSNQALQRQLHLRTPAQAMRIPVGPADDPAETAASRLAARVDQPGTAMAERPLWRGTAGGRHHESPFAGQGEPLPAGVRAFFEPRLGIPLAPVRLHRDGETADTARRISARAFTVGRDIGFGHGEYAPDTGNGRRLLAHELAHVALEGEGGPPVLRRQPPDGGSSLPVTPNQVPMSVSQPPASQQPLTPLPQSQDTDPSRSTPADRPVTPPAGGTTIDPTAIDAHSLTNEDLIARDVDARTFLARAVVSSPETEAWRQLQREIADERKRRVGIGFIFLAERTESSPAMLYQMRAGPAEGTIEIVTADLAAAMGPADVSLTGGIMSPHQMDAYIKTLGYRTISGPAAAGIIANRADIIQRAMEADQQRIRVPQMPGAIGRTPFFDYALSGGYDWLGAAEGPGRLPIDLSNPANFRGRVGEIGMGTDYRTGWGTGLEDFNQRGWRDITGRTHSPAERNFPVLDFGPGEGAVPRILEIRPISVTTSGEANYADRREQYTRKIEALLDVQGRRTAAPIGTDIVLQHLRQASGDASLTAGTPAYQQAQARFLPDTLFAVPDADVAALRNAIGHPNNPPPGGGNRLIARSGGFRDLYARALQDSPLQITLRNGSTVTCSSLAELAARAPYDARFSVQGGMAPVPPNERMTSAEFTRALDVLGQTAASRIVGSSTAPAMAAAADVARGSGSSPATTQTRILEINSDKFDYVGQRIGEGLADPRTPGAPGSGGTRWTTAAETDPVLSAVRALTGNPALQRGTAEFEAARQQALGNAVLAINADDVQAFRGTLMADEAWSGRLRGSFGAVMADNPIAVPDDSGGTRTFRSPEELDAARASMSPEQYEAARAQAQAMVADRVTSSGVSTPELGRLQAFRDEAVTRLGPEASSVLTPDVTSHVRLGSARALGESFGRGGLGGMIISVVTTAGTMYIDQRQHPHWAQELAVSGGEGFALTGAQSAAESGLTYLAARQALQRGMPLSGWSRFGARAGPAAVFAGGLELYNISQEQREHSGTEVVTRTGRAMGIAIVAMEIGAAAGSIVPGAGTAAGAVVGFLVGAAAGLISSYLMDKYIPGGAEDWNEQAAEAEAEKRRDAEARRRAMAPVVVQTLGAASTLTPVMSSPDISEEEQAAIARWATLLTIAERNPPAGVVPPP